MKKAFVISVLVCVLASGCRVVVRPDTPFEAPIRTAILGGGDGHDYRRWFRHKDSVVLAEVNGDVFYTEDPEEIVPILPALDVLIIATNRLLSDPQWKEGLDLFKSRGKGMIFLHEGVKQLNNPGLFYDEKIPSLIHGPTAVLHASTSRSDHPMLKGVPQEFELEDTWMETEDDTDWSGVFILASARKDDQSGAVPLLWTIEQNGQRFVCFSSGHDGKAHNDQTYIRILQNALLWAADRK
jgi:hypothetical protein